MALAGLTGAVGRGTVEVASMIERVGVAVLRLDIVKLSQNKLRFQYRASS